MESFFIESFALPECKDKKGVDVMKKVLIILFAAALMSGAVIAVRKKAPKVVGTPIIVRIVEIRAPGAALLSVLFDMHNPGGKVGGRMRRKMRKIFKKNPMDPELRALAYLSVQQRTAEAKK